MKIRTLLLGAVASLALGSVANATNVDGWYVSLEGGANWIDDFDVHQPAKFTFETDTGWAALGAVGYGMNKWRVEFEGGYRDNNINRVLNASKTPVPCSGCVDPGVSEITLMANVLYDFPVTERVSFTLGVGAGADRVNLNLAPTFDENDWVFAAQAIAGVNFQLGQQTELYVNYHYLWVNESSFTNPTPQTFDLDALQKHAATLGVRFHFGAPAEEPVAAPPPPPPPPPPAAPSTPREFIVFFGHNKSDLTAEALGVVKQAAAAAKEYGSATITVVGHADRSGSDAYNQKLSLKRGNAVKNALVSEGISASTVTVSGKGEGDPMVPTADGVREPQNRRVHITL